MNQFLTVNQICHFLQIPKPTLYYYVSKKEMPARRVGRHLRFVPREVDQWLKDQNKKRPIIKGGLGDGKRSSYVS